MFKKAICCTSDMFHSILESISSLAYRKCDEVKDRQQVCLFTILAMFLVMGLLASTESMVMVQASSMLS